MDISFIFPILFISVILLVWLKCEILNLEKRAIRHKEDEIEEYKENLEFFIKRFGEEKYNNRLLTLE